MIRSLPSLFLLVLAIVVQSSTASFVFRLGAVLTDRRNGTTGEMRDARLGYELFFDTANDRHMDPEFTLLGRNGIEKFSMKYEFYGKTITAIMTNMRKKSTTLCTIRVLPSFLARAPSMQLKKSKSQMRGIW